MSKKRQTPLFVPLGQAAAQLTTLSYDFVDGHQVEQHFHREAQLVYAAKGVMTIRTAASIWVVPPLRAVWIPGGTAHSIAMSGAVQMRTLYFAPRYVNRKLPVCFILNVSPLLRELIIHACQRKTWHTSNAADRRIIDLSVDLIVGAKQVPLSLPQPRDPRAMRVVEALVKDPSDQRTLAKLCREAGGSRRTLERLFNDETGMTFGKWRQQLRLLHAMRLMAAGEKVITAALEAGYNSPSAFIAVFKKALGQTPLQYF